MNLFTPKQSIQKGFNLNFMYRAGVSYDANLSLTLAAYDASKYVIRKDSFFLCPFYNTLVKVDQPNIIPILKFGMEQ